MNLVLRMEPLPGVVGQVIEGEAVLVLPERGEVKVLNPVGARIWQLADGRCTLGDIVAVICAEYAVEPAQAQADVLDFAAELERKGVVKLSL
jgi:hypothetical protein